MVTFTPPAPSVWTQRYGERHRLHRIIDFPRGITPPKRVRIYQRGDHFVLQWWDPAAKQNLPDRVDGDLVEALTRARQIDQRLIQGGTSGLAQRGISHLDLVNAFRHDLERRVNAGEIRPASAKRFSGALEYYLRFTSQESPPLPCRTNREFALALRAFLQQAMISPNGHKNTPRRRMKSVSYVTDVVRAMYAWAADPLRGRLLPPDFISPFKNRRPARSELVGEPDITVPMAAEFLRACDSYQRRLFGLILLYGLRATEPTMLFQEQIQDRWLKVECIASLEYSTKGHRDKRLPLLPVVESLLKRSNLQGLMFIRRHADPKKLPLLGTSLATLSRAYQEQTGSIKDAAVREATRMQLLRSAGGLTYDYIDREFRRVSHRLKWSSTATLKDFRHLFATCMQNAGMPERYIQYLLGHTQGGAAIVSYAHLNQVREHHQRAVESQMQEILQVLQHFVAPESTPALP